MDNSIIFFIAFFIYYFLSCVLHFIPFWYLTNSYVVRGKNKKFPCMTLNLFTVIHFIIVGLLVATFFYKLAVVTSLVVGLLISITLVICPKFIDLAIRASSLDFDFADYFKQHFEGKEHKEDKDKGKLLKYFNSSNLIFSLIIFFILCIFSYYFDFAKINSLTFWKISTLLIILRLVSRSFEIMYAFTRDTILENTITSNLKKFDRIQLAIKSYIEIILMNACLHFLLPALEFSVSGLEMKDGLIRSIGIQTFTNVNLTDLTIVNYFIYLQIITSLCLIVLSIAIYAGRNEEESSNKIASTKK